MFSGNRPTTSIFGVALTRSHLAGELIALYEHITFVEGTVTGFRLLRPVGVELGRQQPQADHLPSPDDDALATGDASTQSLIKFYRANREF